MSILLDEAKVALRVSSPATDSEIEALISAAIADMTRVGIDPKLLKQEAMEPQVKLAVITYCKANYGFDVAESERAHFSRTYQQLVIGLLSSEANLAAQEVSNE